MDRLLQLVDYLRGRETCTTGELAAHLGVSPRSVRRDLTRLRDLDVEVTSEPGRHGGLRLTRGALLPVLRFSSDEALVLALGLRQAQLSGDSHLERAAQSAFRRLEHVLSAELGAQVDALLNGLELRAPGDWHLERVDSATLLDLAGAVQRREQLNLSYRAANGQATRRDFDPYGLVFLVDHWYVTGYCHLRREQRTFRVDRTDVQGRTGRHFTPPEGFDAVETVSAAVSRVTSPDAVLCELWLQADLQAVRAWQPSHRAALELQEGGVRVQLRTSPTRFRALALGLLAFDCPMQVFGPPELQRVLAGLSAQAGTLADGERSSSAG